MPSTLRALISLFAAAVLVCPPAFSFQSPLSDESVREAYFLGQRRDESMAAFFEKYTKHLSPPKSGPYVYAVSLLTPFALLVRHSSRQFDYSAQRAALDHKTQPEAVEISIEIALTPSYGAFLGKPATSRSASTDGVQFRSPDFWRTLKYHAFDGDEEITTDGLSGEPHYLCSQGSCLLSGATVRLEFPAEAFTSDSATIEVDSAEGDPVAVSFNLSSLR